MRARYYNPFLCRFINADPSGFGGGLNYYAYANGNPVSLSDPTGLGTTQDNLSFNWVAPPISGPANPADPFSLGQGAATENAGNSPGSATFENASPSSISQNSSSGSFSAQYPFDNASPTASITAGDVLMLMTMASGQEELLPGEASLLGAEETISLSSTTQATLAGTQNGVLLGTVENGQINLFQSGVGQIMGHSDLVNAGLVSPGAQGFSIGLESGKVTTLWQNSILNPASANYLLPAKTTQQILNSLGAPGARLFP